MSIAASKALPWKNTLLTKEEGDLQNPINYFETLLLDSDTFIVAYDELVEKRARGEYLQFFDETDGKIKKLTAFLVVQDQRGVHWICPVITDAPKIVQPICLMNMDNSNNKSFFRSKSMVGTMEMRTEDFISACSRGFENASLVFLGQEAVRIDNNFKLIASFYIGRG